MDLIAAGQLSATGLSTTVALPRTDLIDNSSTDDLRLGAYWPPFCSRHCTSWPLDLSVDAAQSMPLLGASSLRDLAIAARIDDDPMRLQSALLVARLGEWDEEDCEILYCWLHIIALIINLLMLR